MTRLCAVVAVLACAACAPSINPQMKSATDELIASLKGVHDEPAPASWEPMPWEVGQWMAMKATSKDGPSVSKVSIVGREGDGWWVETESWTYYHHNVSKVLYDRRPVTAQEAVDFMVKVVARTDDKAPETFDFGPSNPAAGMIKSMMKHYAAGITGPTSAEGLPRQDVTVAAGSFKGCAKATTSIAIGPLRKEMASLSHPAVPINMAVSGTSTDGEWVVETLDYGTTGAKSALP